MVNLINRLYNHSDTGKALYGDILIVIIGMTCGLVFAFELHNIPPDDPSRETAEKVYLSMIFPICFTFPAAITRNLWFSRAGLSAMVFFKAYSNIMEWPHPGECTISVTLLGSIAMGVLANISLSFSEKMTRLVMIFVVGSYVSITSPHSEYIHDTFPVVGGAVALSMLALYAYHYSTSPGRIGVHGARLVLACLFVHHTIANLTSLGTGVEQISGLLKTVVIACIGAAATGAFQREVALKEELEILVRKRTEEIELQNKKNKMISMALQASETAIVITDKRGTVVWLNNAFKHLIDKSAGEALNKQLKDVIHNVDRARSENRFILMDAFDKLGPSEGELLIGESVFRLETTPFPEYKENDRFLVVFKDITAGRAKELAEQKAHKKAMLAKAMSESMVTLTHELRTPLQGIMGVTSLLLQQSSDFGNDIHDSLKLIMASSSLLLNLINNLLDVKQATAKSESKQV